MAEETINLFEINIDTDKAVQDTIKLKQEIELLKAQTKKAKDEQGEFSAEYVEYTASLKSAQGELRSTENLTKKLSTAGKEGAGTIEKLEGANAKLRAEQKKLDLTTKTGISRNKEINKQINANTKTLQNNSDEFIKAKRNVGNYTNELTSISPAASAAKQGMQTLGVGIKLLTGPFGLVITAIGLIIGGLKSFFSSSEEGQNALKRLAAVVSTVVGNVIDLLSKLGKSLLQPKKFIDDLRETMNNTFGKVIEGLFQSFVASITKKFAQLGLVFQKFKGLFSDNAEAIQEAQENIVKQQERIDKANAKVQEGLQNTKDLYNETKDAVKALVAEQEREIKIAQSLADRRAQLRKDERAAVKSQAKLELEVAKLRVDAVNKEEFSAEQRLKFLDEAIAKEKQIAEQNKRFAEERAEIGRQQVALSNSTIEDLDEQAQKEAAVFKAQEAYFATLKRLESERQTTLRENAAETKAIEDEKIAQKQADAEKAVKILEDELKRIDDARALNLENEYEVNKNNIFAILDLERERLEAQRIQEVEYAERIGADVNLVNEKYSSANLELARAERDAKLSLAADFAGNVATIFGEQSAVGKAAAVAQTTISTYQAATGAYAALAPIPIVGPGLGIAAAGAAIASGLANVKKILAVKTPGGGSSGGGSLPNNTAGSSTPISTIQSLTPEIGQGIVNRESIEKNNTVQVQPTLVIDNVTNEQNTANNITETASI